MTRVLRIMARAIDPVGQFVNLLVVLLLGVGVRFFLAQKSCEIKGAGLDFRPGQHHRHATLDLHFIHRPTSQAECRCLSANDAAITKKIETATATTSVIPAARVTGMCSLDGNTAVAATTSGLKGPVSAESTVALTALISLRPICVIGSNRPGYTCKPLPSIT